jgi:uncharacterized protein YjbI with pentapeptide repeats
MTKITQEELDTIETMHSLWLKKENETGRADLSGKDLTGLSLARKDLRRGNFRGTLLCGVNCWRAQLQQADMNGADLTGANLSEAELAGADLSGARLEGTNISDKNLRGAILNGTIKERIDAKTDDELEAEKRKLENVIADIEDQLSQIGDTDKQLRDVLSQRNKSNVEDLECITKEIERRKKMRDNSKTALFQDVNTAIDNIKKSIAETTKALSNNDIALSRYHSIIPILFGISAICAFLPLFFTLFDKVFILNVSFKTFIDLAPFMIPVVVFLLIGIAFLRHDDALRKQHRHLSAQKHLIETAAGILEASVTISVAGNGGKQVDPLVISTFKTIASSILRIKFSEGDIAGKADGEHDQNEAKGSADGVAFLAQIAAAIRVILKTPP